MDNASLRVRFLPVPVSLVKNSDLPALAACTLCDACRRGRCPSVLGTTPAVHNILPDRGLAALDNSKLLLAQAYLSQTAKAGSSPVCVAGSSRASREHATRLGICRSHAGLVFGQQRR
jgi:hypothetical protein